LKQRKLRIDKGSDGGNVGGNVGSSGGMDNGVEALNMKRGARG
jgi:hypothetical protein